MISPDEAARNILLFLYQRYGFTLSNDEVQYAQCTILIFVEEAVRYTVGQQRFFIPRFSVN